MDKKKLLMAGAATVALTGLAAQEAPAATATINMNASVVTALSVTQGASLNFGALTEAGAGTVVVDTADGRTASGGVTLVGSTVQSGVVRVTAGDTRVVNVTAPAAAVSVQNGGGTTMTVGSFNVVTDSGGNARTANITTTPFDIPVGATLNVNANQATGTYTGNFQVTVSYQ